MQETFGARGTNLTLKALCFHLVMVSTLGGGGPGAYSAGKILKFEVI